MAGCLCGLSFHAQSGISAQTEVSSLLLECNTGPSAGMYAVCQTVNNLRFFWAVYKRIAPGFLTHLLVSLY